jgi:hypothetical protein
MLNFADFFDRAPPAIGCRNPSFTMRGKLVPGRPAAARAIENARKCSHFGEVPLRFSDLDEDAERMVLDALEAIAPAAAGPIAVGPSQLVDGVLVPPPSRDESEIVALFHEAEDFALSAGPSWWLLVHRTAMICEYFGATPASGNWDPTRASGFVRLLLALLSAVPGDVGVHGVRRLYRAAGDQHFGALNKSIQRVLSRRRREREGRS